MNIHTQSPFNPDEINRYLEEISSIVELSSKEKEKIRLVYQFADLLHHDEVRKDGTRYFEHPKEVAKILSELWSIIPRQVIIALLHDIIENTAVEYNLIKNLFWQDIAESVRKVSKKCWSMYLGKIPKNKISQNQRIQIEELKKIDPIHDIITDESINDDEVNIVFDSKNFESKKEKIQILLSSLFTWENKKIYEVILINTDECDKSEYSTYLMKIAEKIGIMNFSVTFHHFTHIDSLQAHKILWPNIKKLAREKRDEDYFWGMESFSDDELGVKIADRLHNMRNISHLSLEKLRKLRDSTVNYFISVAEKRHTIGYKLLITELENLKSEIVKRENEIIKNQVIDVVLPPKR